MYTLKFTLAFAKAAQTEQWQDLRKHIVKFEDKFNQRLPKDFEMTTFVSTVCEVFDISEKEFYSQFMYGDLGAARQAACYILRDTYNVKARDIAAMTGYTPSRIINATRAVQNSNKTDLFEKIDTIIERMKS